MDVGCKIHELKRYPRANSFERCATNEWWINSIENWIKVKISIKFVKVNKLK